MAVGHMISNKHTYINMGTIGTQNKHTFFLLIRKTLRKIITTVWAMMISKAITPTTLPTVTPLVPAENNKTNNISKSCISRFHEVL